MILRVFRNITVLVVTAIAMMPSSAAAVAIPFQAADPTIAALTPDVDLFRAALGNPNNGNDPGPLLGGRREINWDGGGGVATTAPAPTPFTGFLNNRGALYTTPGTGFVQATPDGLASSSIFNNPTYATDFAAFSPLRLFSPVGSNITDVSFFTPGTGGGLPATVAGFGVVFNDVELANTTSIEYFTLAGISLGTFFAPPGEFALLGVVFTEGAIVARARITTGNIPLGPNANDTASVDANVMDDHLFGEPQPVPEPGTILLVGSALVGVAILVRRRRS